MLGMLQDPGDWPASVRDLVAAREAEAAEGAAAELLHAAEEAEQAAQEELGRLHDAAAAAQHAARDADSARRVLLAVVAHRMAALQTLCEASLEKQAVVVTFLRGVCCTQNCCGGEGRSHWHRAGRARSVAQAPAAVAAA